MNQEPLFLLMGDELKPGASDDEQRVWQAIRARHRVNPIPLREVAALTQLSERAVGVAVGRLVTHHGLAVGSSSDSKRGGYFLIRCERDAREALAELGGRTRNLAARARALDAAAARRLLADVQAELFGGES